MQRLRRVSAAILILAATATGASAIEPRDMQAPVKIERAWTPIQKITLAAQDELAVAKKAPANVREALDALYTARDFEPLWVTPSGLTEHGRSVVKELANADQWGLDATRFDLELGSGSDAFVLADTEAKLNLAVLAYALDANGGRVDPAVFGRNWDQELRRPDPRKTLEGIATASDPAAYLRDLHPTHAQFKALLKAYLALKADRDQPAPVKIPDGPTLRLGDSNAQVALLRQRLDMPAPKSHRGIPVTDTDTFDDDLDAAVRKFQTSRGLTVDGVVGNGTRGAMNASDGNRLERVLINMERWRWMPREMGSTHVFANIPEFRVRVIKDDKILFDERMVVGKTQNATPIFSATMERIEFHPYWNVPNSIKVKEILPGLRSSSRVAERHNLRIKYNGKMVDPDSIDWDNVDVRRFHFYQPPGDGNVLGYVKFMFPNKHDVYMHDTPSKSLFDQTVRTYSHGCMRIRNPREYAETLLGLDRGWSSEKVGGIIRSGEHTPVQLNTHIPVHIGYFTARVNDEGELVFFGDFYGHDRRMGLALNGKELPSLVNVASESRDPRPSDTRVANTNGLAGWARDAFSTQR